MPFSGSLGGRACTATASLPPLLGVRSRIRLSAGPTQQQLSTGRRNKSPLITRSQLSREWYHSPVFLEDQPVCLLQCRQPCLPGQQSRCSTATLLILSCEPWSTYVRRIFSTDHYLCVSTPPHFCGCGRARTQQRAARPCITKSSAFYLCLRFPRSMCPPLPPQISLFCTRPSCSYYSLQYRLEIIHHILRSTAWYRPLLPYRLIARSL